MAQFLKESDRIYRLKIPFDTVYTSVFLIVADKSCVLVDCATTEADVKNYIVPALKKLGYDLADISALVITHRHSDHAGGLDTILALAPDIRVVTDVCDLGNGICTYPLAGHTVDFIGVLDEDLGTLITGDGVQGAGVDKYRCSFESKEAYFETLDRIKADKRINTLLFSHEYEPWYTNQMLGKDAVSKCLDDCIRYVK